MIPRISAIVLCKNEERQIETCLKSLVFCDEIIVIDSGSSDKTVDIVKKFTSNILKRPFVDFSDLRNIGKAEAKSDWILYVDADEEVTDSLKEEILKEIKDCDKTVSAYCITRSNFHLGKEWPAKDKVERLFKKNDLLYWYGEVHESPKVSGEISELKNYLVHRTHNHLEEMLNNTIAWSDFEAQARFETNHPPVTWWRILRMMCSSFWEYFVRQKGYRVGIVGLIESIYQSFSAFVTYAKLWEIQNIKVGSRK